SFGPQLLGVASGELVDRQKIGRFARARSYDASEVRDITAERVPHDEEDEKPRKDFCLWLVSDGEVSRIGEGMGEREAEWVVSVVLARIRPRSWWDNEKGAHSHPAFASSRPPQAVLEAGRFQIAQPSLAKAWLWGLAATGCVTLAGTLLVAVLP